MNVPENFIAPMQCPVYFDSEGAVFIGIEDDGFEHIVPLDADYFDHVPATEGDA